MPFPLPPQVSIPAIPDVYAPGAADFKVGESIPGHRLSIYDPITGAFINLDGGQNASISVLYQVLVELRTLNAQMQLLVAQTKDETQLIRDDQSVAEPTFAQTR